MELGNMSYMFQYSRPYPGLRHFTLSSQLWTTFSHYQDWNRKVIIRSVRSYLVSEPPRDHAQTNPIIACYLKVPFQTLQKTLRACSRTAQSVLQCFQLSLHTPETSQASMQYKAKVRIHLISWLSCNCAGNDMFRTYSTRLRPEWSSHYLPHTHPEIWKK